MTLAAQRTFDDLGAPLHGVPFCILDLETTGGSAATCEITEIGAVRYVGGELDGTFQTLVDPGTPIPPFITVLTGISHSMVVGAPRIEEALPSLIEFIGDAVVVGHNVRFDLGFLDAAARRLGYGRVGSRSVDTVALARRLLRSEVRNLKLSTLAAHFRSPVTPNHRALEDAKATAHVFFGLLERAGAIGVTHLDDLLRLPTAKGSPNYRKIDLTDDLPRRPGVYLFRDRRDAVIYVGKATNLRQRVRSYFYGDNRRTVATMLRELHRIEHRVCPTELEASVTELKLIAEHRPRHNRRSKPKTAHWVRVTDEPYPRLSIVRTLRGGLAHLGPFSGRKRAVKVVEALWDALPIRRCTGKAGARSGRCAMAQLGVAMCPCDGTVDEASYREVIDTLLAGLDRDPAVLLDPLEEKLIALASTQRFEEAGWVRDRHRALADAIRDRHRWRSLLDAGDLVVEAPDGEGAVVHFGRLVATWKGDRPLPVPLSQPSEATEVAPTIVDAASMRLVWKWLETPGTRVAHVGSTGLALPLRPATPLESIAV